MNKLIRPLLAATLTLALAGCGGDSGDSTESSSSSSCSSTHECMNDVCQCTTEGKSGQSCEKDDCESDCRVCSN